MADTDIITALDRIEVELKYIDRHLLNLLQIEQAYMMALLPDDLELVRDSNGNFTIVKHT